MGIKFAILAFLTICLVVGYSCLAMSGKKDEEAERQYRERELKVKTGHDKESTI